MAGVAKVSSIDNLTASTVEDYVKSGAPFDNTFQANPTVAYLYNNGRVREMMGTEIRVPIQHTQMANGGAYAVGATLDTSYQEVFSDAKFDWRHYAWPITIHPEFSAMNTGDARVFDLSKALVEAAFNQSQEDLNEDLWRFATTVTAQDGTTIDPIPLMIDEDPTVAGATYGGLNRATDTFWRNQFVDSSATTWNGVEKEVSNIINRAANGTGGSPDFAVCDQNTWELLEAAYRNRYRITDDKISNLPFQQIALKPGLPLFYDERVPDAKNQDTVTTDKGTLYVMNSKFMTMAVLPSRKFARTPFISEQTSERKVMKILLSTQMVCYARRKMGVLFDIDVTITTAS